MIHIERPDAPTRLRNGVARTRLDCDSFRQNRNKYTTGKKKFNFNRRIYGHSTVKASLKTAQHNKCGFCEGRFHANYPGDVEHYRPKSAAQQDAASAVLYPGYYWLAYVWDNLTYCCYTCNSKKRTFFPLSNPNSRARSHRGKIGREQPLLLDPYGDENPREHIEFRDEFAVGLTTMGKVTIETLSLNRAELIEDRLTRLGELRHLASVIKVLKGRSEAALVQLRTNSVTALDAAARSSAVFSGMAEDFVSV